MSDINTPRFLELDGEEWIESKVGDHRFGKDTTGNRRNLNIVTYVGVTTMFAFPAYGRVPNLNAPVRRTRRGDGSTLVRHRTVVDVVLRTKVKIPGGTECIIYASYGAPRGRYVASFFLSDSIINVLGGGLVKRRDLSSGRYEQLT